MKLKKHIISFLLAGAFSISMISCGNIQNEDIASESNGNLESNSSVISDDENNSSLESLGNEHIESSISEENNYEENISSEPESIYSGEFAAFESIKVNLINYVGSENFDSWRLDMQAQGNAINIKNFVEQFQIDRAALESNAPNLYTAEQLDALYSGDSEAIRTAFGLPANYPIS